MFNEVVKLYSKKIFVTLKFDDTNERRSRINISVEMNNLTSPYPRKELILRLTEESDLFFYYSSIITEEDFQCLKTQQGLLVDFASFPQRFIDLLERCTQEECKENPKYILIFSRPSHQNISASSSGHLDVVETNLFKHLIHLSLNFINGSDSEVKKYLAVCLQDTKECKEKIEKQLAATEADLTRRLQQTQECLSRKTLEFDRLNIEMNEKITSNTSRLMNEMLLEREKNQQRYNELQMKNASEKRELEFNHNKVCQQFEAKISDLEVKVNELNEKKCELESGRRELRGRLATTEDEVVCLRQEAHKLRAINTELNAGVYEKEKLINSLKSKIAVLEQEIKVYEEVNIKNVDLIDSLKEHNRKLENNCDHKEVIVNKLDAKVSELMDDVKKANEIIRKLQSDVKGNQGKLKMRSQIALEQEKLIEEKDSFIEKLHADSASVKEKLDEREKELKDLKEKLESENAKNEKYQKDLKTNENVINWLNKQLNERHTLQQKGIEVLKQNPFMRPMQISPGTNARLGFNAPPPMSTPQNFGYYTPIVGSEPAISHNINTGKANKENDPPLDSKYFQTNDNPISKNPITKNPISKKVDDGKAIKKPIQNQIKKPMQPSNRIPKSALMLPASTKQPLMTPSSAYFPNPTTGTV